MAKITFTQDEQPFSAMGKPLPRYTATQDGEVVGRIRKRAKPVRDGRSYATRFVTIWEVNIHGYYQRAESLADAKRMIKEART